MSVFAAGSFVSAFAPAVVTLAALLIGAYLLTALDQFVALGPRHWRIALLAPLAESVALLRQEDTVPDHADGFLFRSAPIIAVATVALVALVLPVGQGAIGFDPSMGLFYFIVLLSPFVIAVMNAGWSQNAKVGLFGTFRAASQLVSYEVPLGFAAIGAPMAAQSLALSRIVDAQAHLWFVVWQPLGLVIYLVARSSSASAIPSTRPWRVASWRAAYSASTPACGCCCSRSRSRASSCCSSGWPSRSSLAAGRGQYCPDPSGSR